MKEFEFVYPEDLPRTAQHRWNLRHFLQSMQANSGTFGEDGRDVGFGFLWESRQGMGTKTTTTVARQVRRALVSARIISPRSEPYHLTQRVIYIRDGEPSCKFRIEES